VLKPRQETFLIAASRDKWEMFSNRELLLSKIPRKPPVCPSFPPRFPMFPNPYVIH
jgi:hypothetical protein